MNPDGSFSYTLPADFAGGEVTFTYRVTDNGTPNLQSNIATVILNFPAAAPPVPTPVEFISFDAQNTSGGTLLTWKVGIEDNVKGYTIERSTNGNYFTKIGFVPATRSNSYMFTDAQAPASLVFYRVKNEDIDGKYKYSTIAK